MSLETYTVPDRLYLTRGDDVNPNRPLFTGDVFDDLDVPGIEDASKVMIIAHPCSFRVGSALSARILVAAVRPCARQGANAWTRGYFDQMPLPELVGDQFFAANLDELAPGETEALLRARRLACLSEIGINLLQQRLTHLLTRAEIPTSLFNQAFSHTLEEATFPEEWLDSLIAADWPKAEAEQRFEVFVRSGEPSLQDELRNPQARSHVRSACRREAMRVIAEETGAR